MDKRAEMGHAAGWFERGAALTGYGRGVAYLRASGRIAYCAREAGGKAFRGE